MCNDHVRALRRTVELARDGSPDATAEMPPERVWDAIAVDVLPGPSVRDRRTTTTHRVAVLVGVLALVVGAVGGWVLGEQQSPWLTDRSAADTVALGALRYDGAAARAILTLPPGLPDQHLDTIDISVEPLDGDGRHSGSSVLRGTLR